MQREVQDREGVTWSCVQAYAGLSTGEQHSGAKQEAAQVNGRDVEVVCTPGGGAGTVRLTLPADWHEALSDQELVTRIEQERAE